VRGVNFSLFFKVNALLTLLLYLIFLSLNEGYSIGSFILTFLGTISTGLMLCGILYLFLLPFRWMGSFRFVLAMVLFIFLDGALVVDFMIYRLFHFHINAMVLNILVSPDAWDSIQLGLAPLLLLVGLFVGLILFEYLLVRYLRAINWQTQLQWNHRFNHQFTVPLIFLIVTEKVGYGFADLFSRSEIVSKFKVLPLYQPLTFTRVAAKYFGFKGEEQATYTLAQESRQALRYPLEPLVLKEGATQEAFDIFIIAMDAFKYQALNQENAPNLMAFKQDAYALEHHYSGGNATRFGIFSLFYGLNATYWFSFLNAHQPPVFFDILKRLGYQIDIFSSTNTNWPEFRKTCYVGVQSSIHDRFQGVPWRKDQQSSRAFIQRFSNADPSERLFSFLFLDAPHGYSYPEQFNHFGAPKGEVNYLKMAPNTQALETTLKRYKSAIFYDDYLFGKIITALKESKRYDNALIIFTSDHGQEFYEYGNFGHNSAFSKGQVHVPFLIKLPKVLQDKGVIPNPQGSMSEHQDLVPSLLGLLGVKTPASAYSNGQNFFDQGFKRRYCFSASWNSSAIITPYYTYLFSNRPSKIFRNEIRDENYQKVEYGSVDTALILDVMNENKKFLK